MNRRTLMKWLAATTAVLPFHRIRVFAQPVLTPSHEHLLKEIAAVVLPSALGRRETDDIAEGFIRWARNYRAGAELPHGYGFTRLATTGPSPLPTYERQLAELDTAAAQDGGSFAGLAVETRQAILARAFAAAGVTALPQIPNGRHVVADLMAYYFRSGDANDLCYQAEIGRDRCRGLPSSDKRPAMKGAR